MCSCVLDCKSVFCCIKFISLTLKLYFLCTQRVTSIRQSQIFKPDMLIRRFSNLTCSIINHALAGADPEKFGGWGPGGCSFE